MNAKNLDLTLSVSKLSNRKTNDLFTVQLKVKLLLTVTDLNSNTILSKIEKKKKLQSVFMDFDFNPNVLICLIDQGDVLLDSIQELGWVGINSERSSSGRNNCYLHTSFQIKNNQDNVKILDFVNIGELDMGLNGELIVFLERVRNGF